MPSLESDISLLARLSQERDQQAFADLMHRHAGLVYSAAVRVLESRALAEEATQETFFRLLREAGQIRRSVAGWLHCTATTVAIDLRRSETARRKREIAAAQVRPVQRWRDLAPLLDEALAALPAQEQHLLVAHYLQGTPQRELAQQESVSPATLHRKMQAALASLRAELQKRQAFVALPCLGGLLVNAQSIAVPAQVVTALAKLHLAAGAGMGAPLAAATSAGLMAGGRGTLLLGGTAIVGLVAVIALLLAISSFNSAGHTPQSIPPQAPSRALPGSGDAGQVAKRQNNFISKAEMTALASSEAWPDPALGRFLRVPDVATPGPSHLIVLFEHPALAQPAKVLVCYADGSVGELSLDALRSALERQTGAPLAALLPRLRSHAQMEVR